MSLSKTTAVVLKKLRLNEADNILTLLTSDGSKISAIAKGIRKTKSKFSGRLEPFTVVELVLYKGKTLYTVTHVSTIQDNIKLRDYENFVAASAMGELISKVSFEKANDSELFELFVKSLELITKVKNKKGFLMVFDWKIMQSLGYLPNLKNICNCCMPNYFDLSGEGLVCGNCRLPGRQYITIDLPSIKKLKYILNNDISVAVNNNEVLNCASSKLQTITERYIEYQLDFKLRSRNML